MHALVYLRLRSNVPMPEALYTTLFALGSTALMGPDEYDRIAALSKSKLIRLIDNFDLLKDEMNKEQLFQIPHEKLILEWLHDAHRYSNGETTEAERQPRPTKTRDCLYIPSHLLHTSNNRPQESE